MGRVTDIHHLKKKNAAADFASCVYVSVCGGGGGGYNVMQLKKHDSVPGSSSTEGKEAIFNKIRSVNLNQILSKLTSISPACAR